MQETLRYSPVITGVAFLPMIAAIATASNVSNIVLMPRIGPKPVITAGLLLAAAGVALLTRIGPHSGYASTLLGPILVIGLGMGLMFSTAFNTGTYGVAPRDTGVASATVNTGQQLGGSIGTALLNTIATGAAASYLASHLHGRFVPAGLAQLAEIHGYVTAFWWVAGIFTVGAFSCGILMRPGPLHAPASTAPARTAPASTAPAPAPAAAAEDTTVRAPE
jgi:MFS family permease